jgi:hypothetical protein
MILYYKNCSKVQYFNKKRNINWEHSTFMHAYKFLTVLGVNKNIIGNCYLHFKVSILLHVPPGLKIKNSTVSSLIFFMCLVRISEKNSNFCSIQHRFCNRDGECLMSGRNRVWIRIMPSDRFLWMRLGISSSEKRISLFWMSTDHYFLKRGSAILQYSCMICHRCWLLCSSYVNIYAGKSMWRIKTWGTTKILFLHSTQTAVISQKDIILQNKYNWTYKRIFSYLIFTVHWQRDCGPFMGP